MAGRTDELPHRVAMLGPVIVDPVRSGLGGCPAQRESRRGTPRGTGSGQRA
jgi:hypothetical protein